MSLRLQRRTMIVIGLAGILLIMQLMEPKPKFRIERTAGMDLSGLPGTIGLKFRDRNNTWAYIIAKGELVSTTRAIEGAIEANAISVPKNGAEFHYLGDDVVSRGPYLISPDKSHIVVSIAYKKAKAYGATDVFLADLTANRIVFQRKSESLRFIDGIAWSPDSRLFAVLEDSYRRVLSPTSIISACAGHPVSSSTFYLVIYDLRGTLIGQTVVASGVIGGSAELVWF